MKVLVVSSCFPPLKAGESEYAWHLAQHLAQSGAETHVLTTKGADRDGGVGVEVHPLMRDWSWSELPKLSRFLKRLRADTTLLTYLGWNYDHHPMITFLPTLAKRAFRAGRVHTLFHNSLGASSLGASVGKRLLRRGLKAWLQEKDTGYEFGTLLSQSDQVVVFNRRHGEKLTAIYPQVEKRLRWLPSFAPLTLASGEERAKARGDLGVQSDDFVFAYFGFVYPSKGVDTLLQAFRIVHLRHNHARLVIIGGNIDDKGQCDSELPGKMRRLARDLEINAAVDWTGGYATGSPDGSRFLRAADAAVFPFDRGIGPHNTSVAAATAHGLPLVGTRGELTELHLDLFREDNVLFCEPRDPLSLAKAMLVLIEDPDRRSRLAKASAELGDINFSGERLSRELLSLGPIP